MVLQLRLKTSSGLAQQSPVRGTTRAMICVLEARARRRWHWSGTGEDLRRGRSPEKTADMGFIPTEFVMVYLSLCSPQQAALMRSCSCTAERR